MPSSPPLVYGQPIYRPPMTRNPPTGPAWNSLRSAPPPWFSFPRRTPIVIRSPEELDANAPMGNAIDPLLHGARIEEWQAFFSTYDKDSAPKFDELLVISHDQPLSKPVAQHHLDGDNQQINPFIQSYTRKQLMDIGKLNDGSSSRIGALAAIKLLIWKTT